MQVLAQKKCDKRGEVTNTVKCKGKVEWDAITGIKVPDTVKFKGKKWRGTLLQVQRFLIQGQSRKYGHRHTVTFYKVGI